MKIYIEKSLRDFDYWGDAVDTVKYLTPKELDKVDSILEVLNPDGLSEMEINDILSYKRDEIADWLGYNSFEEIMDRDDEDDDEYGSPFPNALQPDYDGFYDDADDEEG